MFCFRCYFIVACGAVTLVRQVFSANFDIFEQVARDVYGACILGFECANFLMECQAKAFCAILYSYFNLLDLLEVCLCAFSEIIQAICDLM